MVCDVAACCDWDTLVALSRLCPLTLAMAKRIVASRLKFMLEFFTSDEFSDFIDTIFAAGATLLGDIPCRLTQSWKAACKPSPTECQASRRLIIAVSSFLNLRLVHAWFYTRGFGVWKGTGIVDGKLTEKSNVVIGARSWLESLNVSGPISSGSP